MYLRERSYNEDHKNINNVHVKIVYAGVDVNYPAHMCKV